MLGTVYVLGAGASGMVAAIVAARKGHKVIIIDRMSKVGKKIYATGNGKCNYTNTVYEKDSYRGNDTSMVSKVLDRFSYVDTISFFEQLGVLSKNKNGYVYPYSEQASSVVEVLQMELDRLGVEIRLDECIESIEICDKVMSQGKKGSCQKDKNTFDDEYEENKHKNVSEYRYKIVTDKGSYKACKIIMAMGGKASPKLGSDGSGIELACKLGHKIIAPHKALVALRCKAKSLKSISGVRLQANIKLIIDGKKSQIYNYENYGEMIFTDYGVSGIPIMQLSRYATKALKDKQKVRVVLDFFPDVEYIALVDMLKNERKINPQKSDSEILIGKINNKLGDYIIKELKKKSDIIKIKQLASMLKGMELEVVDANPWEQAQVMAGGVSTKQIDASTMESKVCSGIYITGELMDVDGTCGGYNLQWAWATGYIAGSSV